MGSGDAESGIRRSAYGFGPWFWPGQKMGDNPPSSRRIFVVAAGVAAMAAIMADVAATLAAIAADPANVAAMVAAIAAGPADVAAALADESATSADYSARVAEWSAAVADSSARVFASSAPSPSLGEPQFAVQSSAAGKCAMRPVVRGEP